MAKDTEKLIRQLSLISFLMAERRPVSALEIKQDVEGYSEMNDDAFARRFYADRAELEALGIDLKVEKPPEGYFEAELYTLPPENFYLPPIEFSDGELAALQTSLALLDGRFAYAEPLRLALQQLSWGRPSPLGSDEQRQGVAIAVTASAGGRELSQRLAKVETAISRRKTIEFEYYSIERDDKSKRKVDPYHLLYQGGQFYLVGHAHERDAMRVFRLSRITDKVSYASKAEHDFTTPDDFDPWAYARRADWQLGEPDGTAQVWISDRIAWLVERDFGQHGDFAPVTQSGNQWRAGSRRVPGAGVVFTTEFAQPRQLVVMGARPRRARAPAGPVRPGRRDRRPSVDARRAPRRSAARLRRRDRPPAALRRRVDERPPGRNRPGRDRDPARAFCAAGRAGRHPDPVRRAVTRGHASRTCASACRSPTRSCARTSTS